jgi:CubicO group peptidase (beta-lactamase class C family)
MRFRSFDPERFTNTIHTMAEGIRSGVAPGMVAALWLHSRPDEARIAAYGARRLEPSYQEMLPTTVFDIASLTKIVATTTLTAKLIERGWISWETPVRSLLPTYPFEKIRVRHLLAHSSGLPAWAPFHERLRARFFPNELHTIPFEARQNAMKEEVFSVSPDVEPDVRCLYSDLSFLLLGWICENVTLEPLDRAVKRWVLDPLEMRETYFRRVHLPAHLDREPLVAATEHCPWRRAVLQGQAHDDNCWSMGGVAGHAGLFSTAEDLVRFSRGMARGFLSREITHALWSRVSRPQGAERTLGWDTPSAQGSSVGPRFSERTVGHLGFTGVSLWMDLEAGLSAILLTNRVHPTRENVKIREFRPQFHDALRIDLGF